MSTKIYSAYICPRFKNVDDMHKKMLAIRAIIKKELELKFQKVVADNWASYIDNNKKTPYKNYSEFKGEVLTRFRKTEHSMQIDPDYEFDYKVMLFPHKGEIYLKIFCGGNYDLEHHFVDIGCKDFHYQNSTDRPEHISAREWNHRIRTWDAILKDGVWADAGFEYTFSPNHWGLRALLAFDNIKKYFPSIQKRARRIAVYKIIDRFIKKDKLPHGTKGYFAGRDYLQTKQGKKELKEKTQKYKHKLSKIPSIVQKRKWK